MDFFTISTKSTKRGMIEIYPKFIITKPTDLMIRGGDFFAVWNEEKGLWSTDEQDVIRIIDNSLREYYEKNKSSFEGNMVKVLYMWDSESGIIDQWHKYCQKQMRDSYAPLDTSLIFSNQITSKESYASKKLKYPLEDGSTEHFDKLLYSLYDDEEATKIIWAIGACVSGASKKIEKFLVLYGIPGTGKGTILKIIEKLFEGYTAVFDAKSLGSASNDFALEAFKRNPLVAIQYDGDLSKIENNARLNSLISHEEMTVNEKHKSLYSTSFNSFLFMGTNKPVKITDNKSGIIRRLIDVNPKGIKIPKNEYFDLMKGIDFELGAIAYKAQKFYLDNPDMYDDYKPVNMMGISNDFYNYMLDSYIVFKNDNGTTLKQAWEMYKTYCEEAKVPYPLPMREFKSELETYFREYEDRIKLEDGTWVRSYYSGFKTEIFEKFGSARQSVVKQDEPKLLGTKWLQFSEQESKLDLYCMDCPAQYATDFETPYKKWSEVNTTLKDIDTHKLHYLKVPENLIVIDFDLKDENGNKCFEKNLEAAAMFPPTYAELSKSGGGIHLHYIYSGDVQQLCRDYSDSIEIKVFSGNSSLRRKVTKCTGNDISTISSGLPIRSDKKVINFKSIENEKALRTIIGKNLNKEYHGATKPSMDFIYKVLEDAYNSGMKYDVSDMYNTVVAFAAASTNQSDYCLKLLPKMHFKSDDIVESSPTDEKPIVFFDVEVFPNLFLINWKKEGLDNPVHRMINPESKDIEGLFKYNLVGFNCRRYDNHILYARYIGYSLEELYNLSQRIILQKGSNTMFGDAYNLSYTDIYDYASKKQSLKKWEVELGIHHQELGMPWDKPVPEERWEEVAEYCDNDVISTEAVWNATKDDFLARQILAEIAGMSVNDTTNMLTTRIIFGREKHPELVYTKLEEEFPGYEFKKIWNPTTQKYDKFNMYRGIDLGFGGYVYAEPGMYGNVALLDVASLHPHSMIAMNIFGNYTKNFKDLVDIRILVKHKEFDKAKLLFDGKLAHYFDDADSAKNLAKALKIAINSVYGLTSASFDNPFRDSRNENNIVALRGALFMKTLQDEVVARGFKVAHIKTDSIKIPDATPEIIQFCMDFAKQYGYTFEHEATYDRICLVNDAVYIAKYKEKDGQPCNEWTATGTQFQIPYVFKKCFTKEPIAFGDLCEIKEVKNTAMYLDFNEDVDDGLEEVYIKLRDVRCKQEQGAVLTKSELKLLEEYNNIDNKELDTILLNYHNLYFVGRVGLFCPVKNGCGGGLLVREAKTKDGTIKYDSVVGTKGYRWLESEYVSDNHREDDIDLRYYDNLVAEAKDTIGQFGDYEWFVSDDPYVPLI